VTAAGDEPGNPYARCGDPETSKKAGRANPSWRRTQGNRLLVAHYGAAVGDVDTYLRTGMTAEEAWLAAGGEVPSVSCYWHRHGDLHREFDPPLLVPLVDADGHQAKRRGLSGEYQNAYGITEAGFDRAEALRGRWGDG